MHDYEATRIERVQYLEVQIKALQQKVNELAQQAAWRPKLEVTSDTNNIVVTMDLCGKRQGVAISHVQINMVSLHDLATAVTDSFKNALFDDIYRPIIEENLKPYKEKVAQLSAKPLMSQ